MYLLAGKDHIKRGQSFHGKKIKLSILNTISLNKGYLWSNATYGPDCNFLGIINKKIRLAVKICYKEGEDDIN